MSYSVSRRSLGSVRDIVENRDELLNATRLILEDPALPDVARLAIRLNNLEPFETVGKSLKKVGVGLKSAVTPMKLYVKYRRNPVVGKIVVGAIVALPIYIGYLLSK